ncbi:hypothetical protein CEP54_015246, partial [Fusarium duplospermum]
MTNIPSYIGPNPYKVGGITFDLRLSTIGQPSANAPAFSDRTFLKESKGVTSGRTENAQVSESFLALGAIA